MRRVRFASRGGRQRSDRSHTRGRSRPRAATPDADRSRRYPPPGRSRARRHLRVPGARPFGPPTELDEILEDAVQEVRTVASVGSLAPSDLETELTQGQAVFEATMQEPGPSPLPDRPSPYVRVDRLLEDPHRLSKGLLGVVRLPKVRVQLPEDRQRPCQLSMRSALPSDRDRLQGRIAPSGVLTVMPKSI